MIRFGNTSRTWTWTVAFLGLLASATAQHHTEDASPNDLTSARTQTQTQSGILTHIDILSTSTHHTTFLRLLQLAKLVPVLNHASRTPAGPVPGGVGGDGGEGVENEMRGGMTLFAPTNEAWGEWFSSRGVDLSDGLENVLDPEREGENGREGHVDDMVADNIHWELRQHLLYHISNYTLPISIPSYSSSSSPLTPFHPNQPEPHSQVQTHKTLLFPYRSPLPPSDSPPTGSPWVPVYGDGDLGGEGQRVRIVIGFGDEENVGGPDLGIEGGERAGRGQGRVEILRVGVGPDYSALEEEDMGPDQAGSTVWSDWPERDERNPIPGTGGGDGNEPEPKPEPTSRPKSGRDLRINQDRSPDVDREALRGIEDETVQKQQQQKHNGSFQIGNSIQRATNGYVIGLNKVLDLPPNLADVVKSDPDLSYLNKLLGTSGLSFTAARPSTASSIERQATTNENSIPDLAQDPHLTIFAPTTKAFLSRFDKLERAYLEGGWGREGVDRVLGGMILRDVGAGRGDGLGKGGKGAGDGQEGKEGKDVDGAVGWRSFWAGQNGAGEGSATTVGGDILSISVTATGAMNINDQPVSSPDHFASNGVLHVVETVILPPDFVLLNSAEKMLLTLNATRFVSLMRATNLSDLYTASGAGSWTILAPTDEVLERISRWESSSTKMSADFAFDSDLKALLQFHVIPGKLRPKDLVDDSLLETELQLASLQDHRQRLRVHVGNHRGDMSEERSAIRQIRFGDATVLAEPTIVGDSIIYLLSDVLDPPTDLIQTAVSEIKLSTFVASLFASGLDNYVKRAAGITYFAPTNNAFSALGLTMRWLLSSEQGAKDDLRKVIRHHAIEGLLYSEGIVEGNSTLTTVAGEELILSKVPCGRKACESTGNRSLSLVSPRREDIATNLSVAINGETRPAFIIDADILTDTGVLHIVDSVELPSNVKITIGKLMEGGKAGQMIDLMIRAGMEWLLNGQEANITRETSQGAKDDFAGWTVSEGYTVLAPRDEAWSGVNMTRYLSDPEALRALLNLHIIPVTPDNTFSGETSHAQDTIASYSRPLSLIDSRIFQTLHSAKSKYGDLVVSEEPRGRGWLIGVNGAYGGDAKRNFGRMLESGRASPVWTWRGGKAGVVKRLAGPYDTDETERSEPRAASTSLGGGIIMIDTVLEPFEPTWLAEHGWTLAGFVVISLVLLLAAGLLGRWWWDKRQGRIQLKAEDEPLEGEEEF